MPTYQLRYAAPGPRDIKRLEFEAKTLPGALQIAKNELRGAWAEFCADGEPVCRLELVAGSGVWFVDSPAVTRDHLWAGWEDLVDEEMPPHEGANPRGM